MTNQARRTQAELALTSYRTATSRKTNSKTLELDLTDLIADLLHLAHHHGYHIGDVLETAETLFQEQVTDNDD